MDLVHVIFEDSGHFVEWYEDSGRLYLCVRHDPSKPSVVRKSQSQRTQSSWAYATFEHDQLAVFCSNVLQRRDSRDCNSERPIVEDGGIEGDKDAGKDINETSANGKGSDSASNEPDSSDKDRSQDRSNTNSNGIDTQNVQDDRNGNGKDDHGDDDARNAKINRLIEKIEKSIKTREDERTRTWIQTLWERIGFLTPAQWDFDSLVDSAENNPFRVVLHKISLHRNLNERIEQGALRGLTHPHFKKQCRDDMLQESPSFRGTDGTLRRSKQRLFNLYVQQGAAFDKLCTECAGLVGLVAPILMTSEIQTINENFTTFSESWKKSGVHETASKFSAAVSAVLAAVPQIGARQSAERKNKTCTSDQRPSKRRCLANGIVTPPSIPPTSAATHATSEETQYHPPEQSQQSLLQHLINPPHPSGYKVSYGGCNGTNTTSRVEMAMDDTAHQSSSNSVTAVQLFQNTPTTVMDQVVTNTAETFNSHAAMGDASIVSNSPVYIHQGNPSIGTLSQEQMGNTGFDPSSYMSQEQIGNTGFDPSSYMSQEQMGNTGFDPSSYMSQEQMETGFDTSSYISQSRWAGFDPSSLVCQENLSFTA